MESLAQNERPIHLPLEGPLETAFSVLILVFPLSRAEHRRGGRIKARGLSELAAAQAKAGEFPRAPFVTTTRRMKRGTGAFFCFRFLSRERK